MEVRRVRDAVLVRSPGVSLDSQHGQVLHTWQVEESARSVVGPTLCPHEIPCSSSQHNEMILPVIPLPPRLRFEELAESNGQLIASRQISLPELTGRVEAAVEGDIKESGSGGIPRAKRVIF